MLNWYFLSSYDLIKPTFSHCYVKNDSVTSTPFSLKELREILLSFAWYFLLYNRPHHTVAVKEIGIWLSYCAFSKLYKSRLSNTVFFIKNWFHEISNEVKKEFINRLLFDNEISCLMQILFCYALVILSLKKWAFFFIMSQCAYIDE